MKQCLSIILLFIISFSYSAEVHSVEKGEEGCKERMIELLDKNPDDVIVHVKGLVCSSCAIGIRIGLSKIDGLNKNIYTKGVKLDTVNQYVTLATVQELDFNLVFKKIQNAGYDPLHLGYYDDDDHSLKRVDFINLENI